MVNTNTVSNIVSSTVSNIVSNEKNPIIVALDVNNVDRAVELVTQLKDHVGLFKVGLELIHAAGYGVFDRLREAGAKRFFYDAKLHDIPNTVAGAMRGVAGLGVWCVTAHAHGGAAMLRAAVESGQERAKALGVEAPRVLAVTLLTSIDGKILRDELQVSEPLDRHVGHLASMAYSVGCAGVIASPHEIEIVRAAVPNPEFLVVTPGVRPAGSAAGDQARVLTPGEAIRLGANYLVIGRPIVADPNPVAAAEAILQEICA